MASNDTSQCYARGRNSVLQGYPFGGVVVVLALDFIIWLVLLLVFSILRKKAWDYGRLALLNDNDRSVVRGKWRNEIYFPGLYTQVEGNRARLQTQMSIPDYESKDKGFCSWLAAIFRIKDDEIRLKCGMDAVHYLSFQRHILVLLIFVSTLSLAVILPVNFSGTLLENSPINFGRTTIANLNPKDQLLWLHTVFAVLYLLGTVFCMRRHTTKLEYASEEEEITRTVLILGIPKNITDENLLKSHLTEAYNGCEVTQINFCYNLSKLISLDNDVKKADKARAYYEKHPNDLIQPRPCSQFCCCNSCGYDHVVGLVYYQERWKDLRTKLDEERPKVFDQPLGMAFVTFKEEEMAFRFLADYKTSPCCWNPSQTRYSSELRSQKWRVRYAPHPNSIIWENLSVQGLLWWVRMLVLNLLLFLLLFFLTTPAIIVNTMDKFNVTRPIESLQSPIITQFFPTLLLWSFSALLPILVYYSVFLEGHWTRSAENQSIMHKCYFYLIIMVLILPSLGLSSLSLFFRWLFDKNFVEAGSVRFECVFLPDNGAFFVNYVITAGFIGTGMELLRVPGLLLYTLRLCWAHSDGERTNVKRQQAYEFQFGQAYAWMMNIFSVVMAYSITCPLITIFGVIYLLLKHMVDRYNIYYAYLPCKLSRKIHSAAVNQVVAAPLLCMFWLLFYSVLRLGPTEPITLFTLVVLVFTVAICIGHSFFGVFKYMDVHKYKVCTPEVPVEYDNVPTSPDSLISTDMPSYSAAVMLVRDEHDAAGSAASSSPQPDYGATHLSEETSLPGSPRQTTPQEEQVTFEEDWTSENILVD